MPVLCPYCFEQARLADSAEVYGGRSYGRIWLCRNYPDCDAYVGVHDGTEEPKGRLANADLRQAKIEAHRVFDPLWRGAPDLYTLPEEGPERKKAIRRIQRAARNRAYAWLAEQMGIPKNECHIGWMDLERCREAERICRDACPELIREWAKSAEE